MIRFDLVKKSTGQITNILGAAVKEAVSYTHLDVYKRQPITRLR